MKVFKSCDLLSQYLRNGSFIFEINEFYILIY